MTPPLSSAGLYKGLIELKSTLQRWRSVTPDAEQERADLLELIQAQAATVDLAEAEPAWRNPVLEANRLVTKNLEMEYELIPHGLHIVGQAPSPEGRADMLYAVAEATHGTSKCPALR